MKSQISVEQFKVINEIYSKDGVSAALQYLVSHEGMPLESAEVWITTLGFTDRSCKEHTGDDEQSLFDHYCVNCNEVWFGKEGSLCPLCSTDGSNIKCHVCADKLKKKIEEMQKEIDKYIAYHEDRDDLG